MLRSNNNKMKHKKIRYFLYKFGPKFAQVKTYIYSPPLPLFPREFRSTVLLGDVDDDDGGGGGDEALEE